MNSDELRRRFLAFFKDKGHTIVPSDSLIPANDPTVLFTGAGMNQFKEYFLGNRRDMKRASSCQKCFRTGDVEQVGKTPSHLTFFEMLGNFSFGDYFKKEAIPWAWEFMTQGLKISSDRLWASVYEADEEAVQVWERQVGLPPDRIIRFGAKENFWPSNAPTDGPQGPCGPCSEIYYDYGRCFIGKVCPDPDHCVPGCPCGRYVEVWNLVFTQFDRQESGQLLPLPAKNIDTGMGLERLAAVMQDKMSVFETDLLEPIIETIVHLLRDEAPQVLRFDQRAWVYAISDHTRALTFLIGEGVVPSNDGRGYVVRMLLRRAARAGKSLGLKGPFLYRLVPSVTKIVGKAYPELETRRESIAKAILVEEERFQKTLEEKLPLFREEVRKIKAAVGTGSTRMVELAAQFYDTHGLSYDEIVSLSQEEGVQPPLRQQFDEALATLQSKSKASSAFSGTIWPKDELKTVIARVKQPTEFVGYSALTAQARVVGIVQEVSLVEEVRAPAEAQILLDQSPFYGEAGGQVGDTGQIQGPEGKLQVLDTQWVGDGLLHRCKLMEGRLRLNDPVTATVDSNRRRLVAQNHTGTHLLHAALRKVLGPHVAQAGSLVAPDRIRFDFSHTQKVPGRQLVAVESVANEWVEANLPVQISPMSLEAARTAGAIALFGQKYGQTVRVVSIGDISRELCGGTHLLSSSEIGCLTIVEEGSVAAGIRRVEALTGPAALRRLRGQVSRLEELAQRLKAPAEQVVDAVDRVFARTKELEDQLRHLRFKELQEQAKRMTSQPIGPIRLVVEQIPDRMDPEALRILADAIRKQEPEAVIFLLDQEGYCVAASSPEAQRLGILAPQLIGLATQVAGGSGGGRQDLAQGQVKEPSKFLEARQGLVAYVQERAEGVR